MSIKEANIELISQLQEEDQKKVFYFLQKIYSEDNPYKPMSADEIFEALDEILSENGL